MGRNDEDWAVFWCSLLSPVLLGEIPAGQREAVLSQVKPARNISCPMDSGSASRCARRAASGDGLRKGGVANLYRSRRNDRGKPRDAQARSAGAGHATEDGTAVPFGRSDQSHSASGIWREVPRSHLVSPLATRRSHQASWAFPRRKSAVAGRATRATRCGSATSSTDRW